MSKSKSRKNKTVCKKKSQDRIAQNRTNIILTMWITPIDWDFKQTRKNVIIDLTN